MVRSLLRLSGLLPILLASGLGCVTEGAAGGQRGSGGGDTSDPANTTDSLEPVPRAQAGGHEQQKEEKQARLVADGSVPECKNDVAAVPFYMSADDSNSMASPVIARELLRAGLAPDAARIRTHEFLNYYDARYEAPPAGLLGVHVEMQDTAQSPTVPAGRFRLQVGVQAPPVPRRDLVLTFVVDSSGSLIGTGIERERAALLAVGKQLQAGDVVNVVTWSTENAVLLDGYVATGTGDDDAKLAEVVNKLTPGGGSDLHAGLLTGYNMAFAHQDPQKLNRLVLLSDGGANLGQVDHQVIASAAEDADEKGIYLVGIGVGPAGGYSDALMDLVTDAGRGAYVYLDGIEEAESVFTERFDEVMNVAARNVEIRVDLPEYMEIDEFYGEKYSIDSEEVKPQTLAPGDSMVLNQTLYVGAGASACGLDTIAVTVTWEDPITYEVRTVGPVTKTLSDLLVPASEQAIKAQAVIAYAEALKSGGKAALETARMKVRIAARQTGEEDLAAIADLIDLHPALNP